MVYIMILYMSSFHVSSFDLYNRLLHKLVKIQQWFHACKSNLEKKKKKNCFYFKQINLENDTTDLSNLSFN